MGPESPGYEYWHNKEARSRHQGGGEKLKIKIAVLVLGLILLSAAGLWGCGGNREITGVITDDSLPRFQKLDTEAEGDAPAGSVENEASAASELIALADTREEAEKIAELYGIELSSYSGGVATYTTDKNPQELIELGAEKDYPELTPNYENHLYKEQ